MPQIDNNVKWMNLNIKLVVKPVNRITSSDFKTQHFDCVSFVEHSLRKREPQRNLKSHSAVLLL